MLRCGFVITEILDVLSSSDDDLGEATEQMRMDIFKGSSLSAAMARQPSVFPLAYVQIIRTGEESGQLANSFKRLTLSLEQQSCLTSQLYQTLIYPLVLILVTAVLMLIGVYGIFPLILKVTAENSKDLPLITKAVILISSPQALGLMLATIFISIAGLLALLRHPGYSSTVRLFLEKHTPLGKFLVQVRLVACIRQLTLMMDSGMNILRSIKLLEGVSQGYLTLEMGFKALHSLIAEGESIHAAMSTQKSFPPFLVSMLIAGEETAAIPRLLERAAQVMEEDLYRQAQTLASLIEPATIAFLGIGVGSLILAILMPIYNMINGI